MSSFQAKIGWKRQRKRENKNYRFVPFLLNCLDKIPKKFKKFQNNSKKIQKIIKIPFWLQFKPKQDEKGREREKIKIIVPFRSVPTRRVRENSKQKAKNFKKLKNTIMASFQPKIGWKKLRKRENKNYCSVSFLPNA